MKKAACFLMLIAAGSFVNSCSDNAPAGSKNEEIVNIRIDYNVETLGIIFALSGDADWLLEHSNKSEDSYFLKLYRKEFLRFKDHAAVKELDALTERKILSISDPYIGLHYSPLPGFKKTAEFKDDFYKRSEHSKEEIDSAMENFAGLVRQFYKDAGLAAFFEKHKMVYGEIEKEVKASMPKENFAQLLSGFYGSTSKAQLTIIPSPALFGQWGFAHSIQKDTSTEFFQLLSHGEERNTSDWNEVNTNLGFGNSKYNFEFAIHEFGHSFVRFLDKPANQQLINSLADKNTDELKAAMEEQGQDTSWANVFEEHLVRSIEILIVEKLGDKKQGQEKLKEEVEGNHFIYLNDFIASLHKYESNRSTYPDLEKYFPVLVKELSVAGKK